MQEFVVARAEAGGRFDKYLKRLLPLANGSGTVGEGGRRFLRFLCRSGGGPASQLLFPVRLRSSSVRAV